MEKIAIFYHIFQLGNWEKLFERQIIALQQSGVYDAANYIHFGINGKKKLPYNLTKVNNTARNKNIHLEADTLNDMHEFAIKNPEYKILYLHTKTVTYTPKSIYWNNVNSWLDYLEYFNINYWETCVDLLDLYDCVGTEWESNTIGDSERRGYAGNFWWANADYISKLDTDFLYANGSWETWRSESWIGTKNPIHYNFYSTNKNKYENLITPEEYKNIITNKPNKNNLGLHYRMVYPKHWLMLGAAFDELYGKNEKPNSILSLGAYCLTPSESIKEHYKENNLIVYQSEPLVEDHWWKTENLIKNLKGADQVWDYDLENIEILRNNGIDAKFKPPLYARCLKRVNNSENPDIDVLFYGVLTPHRAKMMFEFTENSVIPNEITDIFLNLNTMIIWNKHDDALDEFIGRSKIIVNIHPYEGECRQQQTRIFYNLINNKCVLSEKSRINYYGDMIVEFSGHQDMFDKVMYLLTDDNWKKYTQNNFREYSRKILREGEKVFAPLLENLKNN